MTGNAMIDYLSFSSDEGECSEHDNERLDENGMCRRCEREADERYVGLEGDDDGDRGSSSPQ